MKTLHKIINESSVNMDIIETESIDLVVTSPPYPMVNMWDECFISQNEKVKENLENKNYKDAWEEMHFVLNNIWFNIVRVVKSGGFVCINMGDATRTFDGNFQLFSNHSKIIEFFINNGFYNLPDILWRKRTNAPNKFMGSGMLPAGAYVTFEHENILIFRKGLKREFNEIDKLRRQKSAYFYNERNLWFSDVWDIMGSSQKGVKGSRERSGSYPLEIPYRLINMYSLVEDTVLDPFGGLGTTLIASIASGRNSVNFEIDKSLCQYMKERVKKQNENKGFNYLIEERLQNQKLHIESEKNKGKEKFYFNSFLNRDVKTKQEQNIQFLYVDSLEIKENEIKVQYK